MAELNSTSGWHMGAAPSAAPADSATTMIQHVTRTVSPATVEECVGFYRLLGFEPTEPPPGIAGRAVWLALGPTQLHLMPSDDPQPEQGHIAIVAPAYAATLDRLQQAGHAVEPRREHWGSPRAYVRDPAGHLVELMEYPPA
jgi:catechol 2,3-dioxygenase-like lactoylglutathione lyase family enzyme